MRRRGIRRKQGWLNKLYHNKMIKFIAGGLLVVTGMLFGINTIIVGMFGPSILIVIGGSLIGFILILTGTYWMIKA